MDKQLERCLSWALQGLSEHEAWAVKEEVNNAIRRASKGSNDRLHKLGTELERVKTIKRLAEEHIQSFIAPYPITYSKYLEADKYSANPYRDYINASIESISEAMIREAGSAEEAGINKQGEEFNPDYDCPKCGDELDVEYRSCECGYFDEGNADLIADMRAGK